MSDNEIKKINMVRCIGIFFVVIAHYSWMYFNVFQAYIFHMPLFFFLAGVTINDSKTPVRRIVAISKRLIPYIVISYIIIGIIAETIEKYTGMLVGNIFQNGVIETIEFALKNNMHNNKLFLVAWFLVCYIMAYIISNVIILAVNILPKYFRTPLLIPLSLLIGYYSVSILSSEYHTSKHQGINLLCQTLTATMFILLGYKLKWLFLRSQNCFIFIACAFLIAALVQGGFLSSSVMSWSIYNSDFTFFLVGAISGIYCCFFIAGLLTTSTMCNGLEIFGQESKFIMTYHMVCFALITIVLSKITGNALPKEYYNDWYSMPLYVISGMIIPVFISKLTKIFRNRIISRTILVFSKDN